MNPIQSSFVNSNLTSNLLVTAAVNILDNNQTPIPCRSLIDTCSTINFMTQSLASRLQLEKKPCNYEINALNALTTNTKYMVTATIRSSDKKFERAYTFLTVPMISERIPGCPINRKALKIPPNLKLADPNFHHPSPVDLLLGAGRALSLLCIGHIDISTSQGTDLHLQKTRLGWIIGGSAPYNNIHQDTRTCYLTSTPDFDMCKFWEVEEGPHTHHFTQSETACEGHFEKYVSRDITGRYIVALPFNNKISNLGESYTRALNRLKSIEHKLRKNEELKKQYHAVIKEYIDLGHMSAVSQSQCESDGYYLPHHAVIKENSLTTKVRVVFDGSAVTSTGLSLNQTLHVGPTIQSDLISLLLRFRIHQYVITGDIEKMYRQFIVRSEDRKYQRILWRDDQGNIQRYELNTVTFGLASAPYLAIRCLHQLADDEKYNFPTEARIVKQDMYVDDVLTGAPTIEEAITIRDNLITLLNRGQLNIRQWASNDKRILSGLPETSLNKKVQLGESLILKTLGLHWNSKDDLVIYTVQLPVLSKRITKRIMLSEIAKIFDPLGLLGPVIITAKVLLQSLWTLKLDWDESLPSDIHHTWSRYHHGLKLLDNISFSRKAIIDNPQSIQLHGFCDASEKAYGACIYLRSISRSGQCQSTLICAKSRVAPLKSISIPRLELCGAQLLSSLITTVSDALQLQIQRTILWTDSTIVLHWLNTSPAKLKTFAANRVAEIQSKTSHTEWKHVRTHDNPADLLSRGLSTTEFMVSSLWKQGPEWMSLDEEQWPQLELPLINDLPEQRQFNCLVTQSQPEFDLLSRYSSLMKLQRVIAYCMRFKSKGHSSVLSCEELNSALKIILRMTQESVFYNEINLLEKQQPLLAKSKLLQLNPFIDEDGLMRVGGRLCNAVLPFAEKHPIILPKKHHITTLIIIREHLKHLHAGVSSTLYAIRQHYWPIDGRSQVWKTIQACVNCAKHNSSPVNYVMGNLPTARVNQSRPFTHVGIDYCGPFNLKERKYRNRIKMKVYVSVFICLASKAIHLEIVSDLTTEGFIAALRRFVARRGHCLNIYSDNGTNFVGANKAIKEIYQFLTTNRDSIEEYLSTKCIKWQFNPPLAPQ